MANYEKITNLIYQNLAWGPTYKFKDGDYIKDADNKSDLYIKESLKIMKIKLKDLQNKKVFNIGTGRESRFFAKYGAEVTHLDLGKDTVTQLKKWAKKNKKKINSYSSNILKTEIGRNKYDIIFLSGIYQHIEKPAYALVKFINALKVNGLMYMGFYRSGEFKYFIVDTIRFLIKKNQIKEARNLNSILYSLAETNHYQTFRVMDDFFVPKKHNFHPKDIISDIKLLGGSVFYFDKDFRNYNHKGSSYFSIGGDRIYVTKKKETYVSLAKIKKRLKTIKGKNQIFDVIYKDKLIKKNIKLILKIKHLNKKRKINDKDILNLCIGLYQFTRPLVFDQSDYFLMTKKLGRHVVLNKYLSNFIKNFNQSSNENRALDKKFKYLGLN